MSEQGLDTVQLEEAIEIWEQMARHYAELSVLGLRLCGLFGRLGWDESRPRSWMEHTQDLQADCAIQAAALRARRVH